MTTQKQAAITYLKRNRKYIDGTTLQTEVGPSALRRLREARDNGEVNYTVRKGPDGMFQYKIA